MTDEDRIFKNPAILAIEEARDRAIKERDEARAEVEHWKNLAELQGKNACALFDEAKRCQIMLVRWVNAIKEYEEMAAGLDDVPKGALEAMRDSDLDALEKAVGIKEKS